MSSDDSVRCALCQREVPRDLITQHHLKPRQKGGKPEHRTPMCKPCHKQIHATFSNADLARRLDDIQSLRTAALLQPFLNWIRRQPAHRTFSTRRSHAHPHHGKRRY